MKQIDLILTPSFFLASNKVGNEQHHLASKEGLCSYILMRRQLLVACDRIMDRKVVNWLVGMVQI